MPKQYNIRWTRSDYSRLAHAVKKQNAKVFDIEVKRPDISKYQPNVTNYQEIKETIKTRQDLNRFLNRVNRYMREGAEEITMTTNKGAPITKYELREMTIRQNTARRRELKMINEIGEKEVTIGGVSTGNKRKEMGSIKENALKTSKKNINNMSRKEFELEFKRLENILRDDYTDRAKQKMIENYILGLRAEGYSEEMQNLMLKIPLDKFMNVVNTDEIAQFSFIYDPIELKNKENRMKELWQQYEDDNTNTIVNFDTIDERLRERASNG